jgi:CheY-like chemotaxis protein/anti-sigma regulatory factor (Ser/Thr protein kinase)
MSELMRTDNLDDQQREFFEDIKKMSRVLLTIINDILDFSKIEVQKVTFSPVHFSLPELVENLASISRFSAHGKNLYFDYDIEPCTLEYVYGDDLRIRQILTNILSNAIKYTRSGSVQFTIGPSRRNGKDYTFFSVRDTGIGIKSADIPKLFNRFEQFDSRKNREIMGTGLGLAISKHLTDMMEGLFEVESEHGKGSCFTVFLPLLTGDKSKILHPEVTGKIISDGSVNVLIVDDNPINIKVADLYLAQHNIKADFALAGAGAIELVKKKKYDLIFMDHMMPDMDGLDTATEIRKLNSGSSIYTPIVMLSANVIEGTRELFQRRGMNDFISKPIDGEELNRVLAKWLPMEKVSILTPEEQISAKCSGKNEKPIDSGLVLNMSRGLANTSGNKTLYIQLLRDFMEVHINDIEMIKSARETGDQLSACRLAHTIKSSSSSLGGIILSKTASRVEKAFENFSKNSAKDIDMVIADLEKDFAAFVKELSIIISDNENAGMMPDTEKIQALIQKLMPFLEKNSSDIIRYREEMEDVFLPLGESGMEFIDLVDVLEYEKAALVLSKINETLHN